MKRRMRQLLVFMIFSLILISYINRNRTYTNDKLGFSIKIPKSWEDRYFVVEEGNQVLFLHNPQDSSLQAGLLFSISREIGSLITQEDVKADPIQKRLLLQEAGYSFIEIKPSDIQYNPKDKVFSDYKSMVEDIDSITDSIKYIGINDLIKDGYKTVGSSFFKLDIPKNWEIVKDNKSPFIWKIYKDHEEVGSLELVLYNAKEKELEGYNVNYIRGDRIRRKIRFSLKDRLEYEFYKIASTFKVRSGNYTSLDYRIDMEDYIYNGGRLLRGTIKGYEFKDNIVNSLSIMEDGRTRNYPVIYMNIVPLEGESYNLYGYYNLNKAYVDENPDFNERLYEIIVDKNGYVTSAFEI